MHNEPTIARLPLGIQSFRKLRDEGLVYVDKTDLVYALAQKHICFFCRPRRFGKSLLVSTLESYFRGERALFAGLKMEALETEWRTYPVLHLDFAQGGYEQHGVLAQALDSQLTKWEQACGLTPANRLPGMRFTDVVTALARQTGQRVVVLVDEYDKPLLDAMGTDVEEENRALLREFYGTFKVTDEHLQFVFITGVTKFQQVSIFSGFNQPEDLSMDSTFDALCGITEQELHDCFGHLIGDMAATEGIDEDELYRQLKHWYDGYHFSRRMLDIYNPFSILNALSHREIRDWWFASGTPTALLRLLDSRQVSLQELTAKSYAPACFIDYKATADAPLPMLYQSGYLTIKATDTVGLMTSYRLDFPNLEVCNGFTSLLASQYFAQDDAPATTISAVAKLLQEGRLDDLRDTLTAFFASIPYSANWNERAWSFESHYQYTMYLVFRLLAGYVTLIEKQNAQGRADMIVETATGVYIFEFKLDDTAAAALRQIDDNGYALPYRADARRVYAIGVSFSSTTRTIDEWECVEVREVRG